MWNLLSLIWQQFRRKPNEAEHQTNGVVGEYFDENTVYGSPSPDVFSPRYTDFYRSTMSDMVDSRVSLQRPGPVLYDNSAFIAHMVEKFGDEEA